jgi:hypothetical protein
MDTIIYVFYLCVMMNFDDKSEFRNTIGTFTRLLIIISLTNKLFFLDVFISLSILFKKNSQFLY